MAKASVIGFFGRIDFLFHKSLQTGDVILRFGGVGEFHEQVLGAYEEVAWSLILAIQSSK
jgi:hypothetical protein